MKKGSANIGYAILKKSSLIKLKECYGHLVTSACTVGLGGSLGLESPMVSTGSAIGSNYGRAYQLSYRERTILLGCGGSRSISYDNRKFPDTRVWYSDSTFFDIFSFQLLKGNPATALVEPYSIILTESSAKRYFGNDDPIGKTMAFSDTISLTVTGLLQDFPKNSHIQFDVLLSRSTITDIMNNQPEDNWFNNGTFTYLLLKEGVDYKALEKKFPAFLEREMAEEKASTGLWYDFVLQPLQTIHLHSTAPFGVPDGNIKYLYSFIVIGLLVLLIACANYINLSTARAMNRAKELGMRKVIGAKRKQLVWQLLSESCLLTIVASILAMVIASAMLPLVNDLTGKSLTVSSLISPNMIMIIVSTIIVIGLLAGIYPALSMSGHAPVKVMKDFGRSGRQSHALRRSLVVFQFAMSVILIAGTIVIFRQLDFMQEMNLGLAKDQILQVRIRPVIRDQSTVIRNELSNIAGVDAASISSFSFSDGINSIATLPEGANANEITSESTLSVDHSFIETFGLSLVAGRNFSRDILSDDTAAFIVNESAVRHFNWGTPEQAIGKTIDWGLGKKGSVIGVVKDFNYTSLHETIKPVIIHIVPGWYSTLSLRISGDVRETVQAIENKWKTLHSHVPFEYFFMDDDFNRLYRAEEQTRIIVTWLSALAIVIACLGLFGLAAFTAEQRAKEVGVRKVLGADVSSVVLLLSADFLKPVLISIVLAIPVTIYAANQWLTGFAYKVNLSWWIFALAGFLAILIALLTVSFQAIRAAIVNPVKSLRSE